jgi:hypothetical protein
MLRRNTLFAAAEPGEFAPFLQFLDSGGHDSSRGGVRFGAFLPRLGAGGQLSPSRLLHRTMGNFLDQD